MSCQITLNDVVGLELATGAGPVQIRVSGAVDVSDGDVPCDAVRVSLIVGGVVMSGDAPVDSSTTEWSIDFLAGTDFETGDVPCGVVVKLNLECAEEGSKCPKSSPSRALHCRPRDCPDEVVLQLVGSDGQPVATDQGCVPAGTYTVEVLEPLTADNIYQWSIDGTTFNAALSSQPQSPPFTIAGDEGAVSVGVFIQVVSVPGCVVSATLAIDVCAEPSGNCPETLEIELIDLAGDPVMVEDADGNQVPAGTAGTCVPAGTYRGRVASIAPDDSRDWGISGAQFEAGADDQPISPPFELAPDQSAALSVTVVSFSLACLPGIDPLLVTACIGAEIDCSEVGSMSLELELPAGVQPGACLPPGRYVARVTAPDPAGLTFSWSRDGVLVETSLDPVNYPLAGPAHLFEIESDQTVEITAATQIGPGCPFLSDGIEVVACDCPDLVLVVVNENGDVVDTEECVDPGKYEARIRGIVPPGTPVRWRLDGVDQNETDTVLGFEVPENGEVVVHAVVESGEDCRFEERVVVRACVCPEDLALQITDATGSPVTGCVTPGDFVVRVSGEGVTAENTTWNVDGVTITDALEVPVTVTGADGVGCAGGAMGPLVTASVGGRNDCPDRFASTLLNICNSARFNPCCWLWRIAILIFAVLTMIGIALMLCPQVVFNPLIPQTAQLVPFALITGAVIAGVAGVISIVLGIVWMFLCRPTWCNDWLVLLWQFCLGGGFVFVYFGACPTCALLPLGAAIMLIGIGLFIVWVGRCRPTLCRILFEIGTLGLVQVAVGWIEFVLVVCIWQWGWLLQLLFVTALNFVGWIGTVIACRVNPNA